MAKEQVGIGFGRPDVTIVFPHEDGCAEMTRFAKELSTRVRRV